MIKKLRKKFVLMTALLIFGILLAILAAFCINVYCRQEQDGYHHLEKVLERGFYPRHPKVTMNGKKELRYGTQPGFCVEVNEEGEITLLDMQYYSEVEQSILEKAVHCATEAEKERGVISSMNLRYVRQSEDSGFRIAFADVSAQRQQLQSYMESGLLIILVGMLAVVAVVYFLSEIAVRPVEKAWVQQKQFVADASHEIKTPLTIILTNADILLANADETIASQRKWVEYLKAEAERMKDLVENMLFLAKSDAGKDLLIHSDIDLSEVAWNSMLPFESVAYEKGITMNSDIAPGVKLQGNASGLGHLMMILLDNACKYTPVGGTITLKLERKQEKVLLSVNNTCSEAIPKEKLEHIFDRFYRVDEARNRDAGGHGLGLAIAKTLAMQHQAKIWAKSTKEEGVTIFVEFNKTIKKRKRKKQP